MTSPRALLSVLLLAFVVALGAGPKRSSACAVLPSFDFPLNDISCFVDPNGVNIYSCAQSCTDTVGCVAFLWDPSNHVCCLKHTIVNASGQFDTAGRTTVITGYADCRYLFNSHQP